MATLSLLTLALAAFTTAYPARTPEPASATPPALPCRVAGGEMKCLPGTADTAFPVEQLKAATIPEVDSEMVQREHFKSLMPPPPVNGRINWPRDTDALASTSDDEPLLLPGAVKAVAPAPTPTHLTGAEVMERLPKYPMQIRDEPSAEGTYTEVASGPDTSDSEHAYPDFLPAHPVYAEAVAPAQRPKHPLLPRDDPAPAPDAMRADIPEVDPTAANLADMMKKLQDGVDRCEAGEPLDDEDCNPDKMPVTQDSLDLAKGLALAEQSAQIMDLEDNLEKDGKAPPRKAPEKTKLEDLLDGDCSDASEFCGGRMVGPS